MRALVMQAANNVGQRVLSARITGWFLTVYFQCVRTMLIINVGFLIGWPQTQRVVSSEELRSQRSVLPAKARQIAREPEERRSAGRDKEILEMRKRAFTERGRGQPPPWRCSPPRYWKQPKSEDSTDWQWEDDRDVRDRTPSTDSDVMGRKRWSRTK